MKKQLLKKQRSLLEKVGERLQSSLNRNLIKRKLKTNTG